MFGENLQIGDENITVLPVSDSLQSVIKFLSPETLSPGVYEILVFPKSCPRCGKQVTFSFVLRDPNQPELLNPVPTDGQRYPRSGILDYVRLSKFPSSHTDLKIRFIVNHLVNFTVNPTSLELEPGGIAAISYHRPSLPAGKLTVSIDITTQILQSLSETKSAVFPFTVYDETAIR